MEKTLIKYSLTDKFLNNGSLITKPLNIAYLILVHRLPHQFKRLFKAIYATNNYYLINIDDKADKKMKEEIISFLQPYTNVFILNNRNVNWGGYSMVQVELEGMKYLLDINTNWDYFINLSGQDYPLKSQKIIQDFLVKNKGKSYLKITNQKLNRPETMNRIDNYYDEEGDQISKKNYKRKYLENVIPYIGGQWMMLTRECCEFICNSREIKKFEDYYTHTLIPDESFFQTALMNTSFEGILINDDKRAIIWIPDGSIKLRPKTFTIDDYKFLHLGGNLFARKFDDNIDNHIIDEMKPYFNQPLTSKVDTQYNI